MPRYYSHLRQDEERDKLWYEIIRLELLISEGHYELKASLRTHRRRYDYICENIRRRFIW